MSFQELLEALPMWGVFLAFALLALVLYELGFRFGRWWQVRTPEEKEGPTGMMVGSIFALMAFLLAITMGMASDRFDGHDVLEVRKHMAEAVDRARRGDGPTLLEVMTYRFRGHSMSDPGKYRTKEELEERKKRDPVKLACRALIDGGMSEDEAVDLDAEVEAEVQDAVAFAEAAEPAKEEVMWQTVMAAEVE